MQSGREVDGEFRANSSARYEISPDDAVMAVSTERRAFTQAEATQLHRLLDTLSLYCAESVVWWNQGQGRKLEENEQPDKRKHHSPGGDPERHKVDNPAPKPAPSNKAELVAIADQRR